MILLCSFAQKAFFSYSHMLSYYSRCCCCRCCEELMSIMLKVPTSFTYDSPQKNKFFRIFITYTYTTLLLTIFKMHDRIISCLELLQAFSYCRMRKKEKDFYPFNENALSSYLIHISKYFHSIKPSRALVFCLSNVIGFIQNKSQQNFRWLLVILSDLIYMLISRCF